MSSPDAYPEGEGVVEVKQTHLSWVFMTAAYAWKLKKPVRYEHLDFSTPEARRANCEAEVRLNQRLAPGVYLGIVPLLIDPDHRLRLGRLDDRTPAQAPIDWIVQMRRLPSNRLLDEAIKAHSWSSEDLDAVGCRLTAFYKTAPKTPLRPEKYRNHLEDELIRSERELSLTEYGIPQHLIQAVIHDNLELLRRRREMFDERVLAGKVVEAHGDLRPEHVCLLRDPVIIDCLEFSSTLRTLDPASELTYLALECERLGAKEAGEAVLSSYWRESGDSAPQELLQFYRAYHAALRARIALCHIRDGETDVSKWISRGLEYLHLSSKSTNDPPP